MILNKNNFERIIENLHDGLYFVNRDGIITYWNKAAERISGFSREDVLGKLCTESGLINIDNEGNRISVCPLKATMEDGKPIESEFYLHHKNGHRIPVSVRINALTDDNNEIIGATALLTDISHQTANKLRVQELEKLALIDNLTQLGNRRFIERTLDDRFKEMTRQNVSFGVLFFDIDKFKYFNDTYGHNIGDLTLRSVANTLIASSRPFDFYGRWGGEEFIGVIRNISHHDLEKLGGRLRRLVNESSIIHKDKNLHITISIGATLARENDTKETLLKRADELMYQCKRNGRNRLAIA